MNMKKICVKKFHEYHENLIYSKKDIDLLEKFEEYNLEIYYYYEEKRAMCYDKKCIINEEYDIIKDCVKEYEKKYCDKVIDYSKNKC